MASLGVTAPVSAPPLRRNGYTLLGQEPDSQQKTFSGSIDHQPDQSRSAPKTLTQPTAADTLVVEAESTTHLSPVARILSAAAQVSEPEWQALVSYHAQAQQQRSNPSSASSVAEPAVLRRLGTMLGLSPQALAQSLVQPSEQSPVSTPQAFAEWLVQAAGHTQRLPSAASLNTGLAGRRSQVLAYSENA